MRRRSAQPLEMPLEIREKFDLVAELHMQHIGSRPVTCFLRLFDLLIDEIRKENDNVTPEYLMHNQGMISVLLQLKDNVQNGLVATPAQEKTLD